MWLDVEHSTLPQSPLVTEYGKSRILSSLAGPPNVTELSPVRIPVSVSRRASNLRPHLIRTSRRSGTKYFFFGHQQTMGWWWQANTRLLAGLLGCVILIILNQPLAFLFRLAQVLVLM